MCTYTCATAYTVNGFLSTSGLASCQDGSWSLAATDHVCTLDLAFLGIAGGGAIVVLVAAFAVILVVVRRNRAKGSFKAFHDEEDPFAREPSKSSDSLLDDTKDPFAEEPRRPSGGLTNDAMAQHREKHQNSRAAVERWTEDGSSTKSGGRDIMSSGLFDDDDDMDVSLSTKKRKKKSRKKDKKGKRSSRASSFDETASHGTSLGRCGCPCLVSRQCFELNELCACNFVQSPERHHGSRRRRTSERRRV